LVVNAVKEKRRPEIYMNMVREKKKKKKKKKWQRGSV
jgi:hypothetical protein